MTNPKQSPSYPARIAANLIALLKSPQGYGFIISMIVAAILAMLFFYPDAGMGNQLRQHDMQQGEAIGREVQQYLEENPDADTPRWTNSLFSGMPTFQINPSYPSDGLFSWITKLYGLGLPSPSNLLFMMMFGFIIMMACLGTRWYYGLIGAIAWGFSTYFIIIIGAGHIWKFVTLAYIPPTIGGIILAYRGRYLGGSAVAALFAMMQIQSNHVQMTYYFIFLIAAIVTGTLVKAFRSGTTTSWLKATGMLAMAAILAVVANLPSLYNTYGYSRETMRGTHSYLSSADSSTPADSKSDGLDRDYITQYSYGRAESFSLLIPDIKGGASVVPQGGSIKPTSVAELDGAQEKLSAAQLNEYERQYVSNYVSQYFGEPEGTNGPVYVGAIIFTLFILGCIIVRGPLKWALLVITLLSVGLAMGRNLMWLTDIFIDYIPMYSKFRTVESILVLAEFTMPLLAVMALQKLFTTPDGLRVYSRPIYIAFGLTSLICFIGWLFPATFGPAITEGDLRISEMIGYQLQQGGYPAEAVRMLSINNPAIASVVESLRYGMVSSDSLRSLVFILLSFSALLLLRYKAVKPWMSVAAIGLLVVVDLYTVNHRYLNHDSFCSPQVSHSDPFPLSQADRQILADTAMNYRVMDIPRFYQAAPSYHHKAVGGYHAAKLTRYQDLIDRHLSHFTSGNVSEADIKVLNMLNTKYIIGPDGEATINPGALGNAWFVENVQFVDGSDAEMDALSAINPATTAVADKTFASTIPAAASPAPSDTIFETSYAPHRLTYRYSSANGGPAVFSEVYFPWGWKATLEDGTELPIARFNYLLRGVNLPAGEHTLTMEFRPASVDNSVTAARIAVIIIYIMVLAAIALALSRPRGKEDQNAGTI